MDAPGCFPGAGHGTRGWLVKRQLRAAGQRLIREPGLRKNRLRGFHMERLAIVRRGAQRKLLRREGESIDAAGFDERQGLEHLDGGANETVMRRITGAGNQPLLCVDDRDVNAMDGFDEIAANCFDETPARLHLRRYPYERDELDRDAAAFRFDEDPLERLFG